MTRKTIDLPEKFIFSTEYDVLYSEVNSANHLGADRVLPIAMEAQLRFIKHLGYTNAIVFEDAGLIMGHSEVQYIAEADYADKLKIELAARNFAGKSFELVYRISNLSKGNELARVATTLLFFDYRGKKVIAIPSAFTDRLNSLG
ncbi:MAG: thioesterase family protein [Halioglobus sp.]